MHQHHLTCVEVELRRANKNNKNNHNHISYNNYYKNHYDYNYFSPYYVTLGNCSGLVTATGWLVVVCSGLVCLSVCLFVCLNDAARRNKKVAWRNSLVH